MQLRSLPPDTDLCAIWSNGSEKALSKTVLSDTSITEPTRTLLDIVIVIVTPCAQKDASPKGPAYANQAIRVQVGRGAEPPNSLLHRLLQLVPDVVVHGTFPAYAIFFVNDATHFFPDLFAVPHASLHFLELVDPKREEVLSFFGR